MIKGERNMYSESGQDYTREEIVIDLSDIPVKPVGKKEIQQLEMALIIGTLYSPEVLELIKDPVERATWVDSLAVAAAAIAREKAGYTVPQIAEEVGRSETSIRAHLMGKTKAGKLVRETYEKLKKGTLKLVVPFIKVGGEMLVEKKELEELRRIRKEYEEKIRVLENKVKELEDENNVLKKKIEELNKVVENIKRKAEALKELIEAIEGISI